MRLFRGQPVTFEKILKDLSGAPISPATRVEIRITDPNNKVVAVGPASYNLDTQAYSYRFIVPLDAPYSTLQASWKIDWFYTLATGPIDVIVEFDVVTRDSRLPENDIVLSEKTTETVQFYLPAKAESGTFEILDRMGKSYLSFNTLDAFTVIPNETGYIYTISLNTSPYAVGDYLLKITAVLPDTTAPYIEMIRLRIVPLVFWVLYPSMLSMLDKIRKNRDLVQAYSKSDLYEYLIRGVAMLNVIPPQITGWSLEGFPIGDAYSGGINFSHYLISAACAWGLQAQSLLYSELNFDFTGQTISLGYNPDGANSQAERLLASVNEKFPTAKELYLRQTQRTATIGVRRQFYNQGLSRLDTLRRALDIQMNYINKPLSGLFFPVG